MMARDYSTSVAFWKPATLRVVDLLKLTVSTSLKASPDLGQENCPVLRQRCLADVDVGRCLRKANASVL